MNCAQVVLPLFLVLYVTWRWSVSTETCTYRLLLHAKPTAVFDILLLQPLIDAAGTET
jgi:hypothetical protein